MPEITENARWAIAIILGAFAYFLKRDHKRLETDIMNKVDKDMFDESVSAWREEVAAMEQRHKDQVDRMERQYELKFGAVVDQFTKRIGDLERHLSDKMEMVIKLIEANNK
jgi:rubrerythrin